MEAILFGILVAINLYVAFVCWDVFTSPVEVNLHWRLTALWAFIANLAIFGFNFWLALVLFS